MTFVSEFGPIDVGTPVSHKRTTITKYIVKTKNQPEMKRDTCAYRVCRLDKNSSYSKYTNYSFHNFERYLINILFGERVV